MDADKDGLVSRTEFDRLLTDLQIGLDPDEIQAMYTKLRDDGNVGGNKVQYSRIIELLSTQQTDVQDE